MYISDGFPVFFLKTVDTPFEIQIPIDVVLPMQCTSVFSKQTEVLGNFKCEEITRFLLCLLWG